MLITGKILVSCAILGLIIVALIAFPSLRKAIIKGMKTIWKKLIAWSKKHIFVILAIILGVVALIFKDVTINLLYPFSYIAVIALALCLMSSAIFKKSSKHIGKVVVIALCLIFAVTILKKLPW